MRAKLYPVAKLAGFTGNALFQWWPRARLHARAVGDDQGTAYGFAIGDLGKDGLLGIAVTRP